MKKKFNGSIVIIGILVFAYFGVWYSNIFRTYSIGSISMEPNLNIGSKIYVSSLLKYDYNSIVVFNSSSIEIPGIRESESGEYIGRLVGKEGDNLEIIDGYTYINGLIIDSEINLKFYYKADSGFYESNKEYFTDLELYDELQFKKNGYVYLTIEEIENRNYYDEIEKYDPPFRNISNFPFKEFVNPNWSALNYGPILIPENKYFIIGDNRQNSEDSRHKGFVDESEIIATVFK